MAVAVLLRFCISDSGLRTWSVYSATDGPLLPQNVSAFAAIAIACWLKLVVHYHRLIRIEVYGISCDKCLLRASLLTDMSE
jgi:hypothetical protein